MNNIVIANLFKQKEPTVEKTLGSLLEIHNDFKLKCKKWLLKSQF